MIENKISKIAVYFLYLLAFASALYMFEAIQSIIMSIASLFLLFQYNSKNSLFSFEKAPFILSFFILMGFNLFYYNSKSLQIIANSFLIFIVPLFSIFLCNAPFFKHQREKILFVYSTCVALISTYIIFFYINDIPNHRFNWYFARFNLEQNIHIHGTYISLWIGIAFLILFNFLVKSSVETFKFKILLIIVSIILLASLVIVNTRMILFSILFLTVLNCCFLFYKKRNLKAKMILFPIILLFLGAIFLSQRYKDDIAFLNKNNIESSTRYTTCFCSLKVIANSHFLGTSNSTIQSKLNKCYEEYGFNDLSKENLNSHNQYLDYFMKGGFLLFITFIATLFIKLQSALKSKNYLYFSICLLFTFSFLTENILVRQYGIYIYLFCDIIFLGSVLTYKSHCTNEIEKS